MGKAIFGIKVFLLLNEIESFFGIKKLKRQLLDYEFHHTSRIWKGE